jgi:asparagine synthase (glutamine-hydrolysing)
MCGIAGIISLSDRYKIDEFVLESQIKLLKHRGPDGDGFWISDKKEYGLTHTRLAILELNEKASQPMSSPCSKYKLTYNGEIYNFLEIKEKLNRDFEINWRTENSDTEVLLYALIHYGKDAIELLRGMFAFCFIDITSGYVLIARDRIGIKPLYFYSDEDKFVFASEIKAIFEEPSIERKINEEAVFDFLTFLTTPAPNTLFKNIYKLECASYIEIKDTKITKTKYWDPITPARKESSIKEEANKLLNLLDESVKLRAISDVDVGVFLSGGVDSSTNVALFSKYSSNVKTFSIGYDQDYSSYKSELSYAAEMANYAGAEYNQRLLSVQDFLTFIDKMVYYQDEPIADPVCVPVYYVSKLAIENNIKVCQVGEGADELLHGYGHWRKFYLLGKLAKLPFSSYLSRVAMTILRLIGKEDSEYYEWASRISRSLPVFWGGANGFTQSEKKKLYSKEKWKEKYESSSWESISSIRDSFEKKSKDKNNVDKWMTYIDLNLRLPELLLMRVDKMTMANALEARVPFLDHKFVEHAYKLSYKLKYNKVGKFLLKKAVEGLIPNNLIYREKQGFGAPVYDWLFDDMKDEAKNSIQEFNEKTALFDKEYINQLFIEQKNIKIWYLFNLARWWKINIDH